MFLSIGISLHWDPHPRTYSASRQPTWKPSVTDHLVPVPQNYEISSQLIFGQLGVWQSSNDNWKHICSKMYLSNNDADINIYPLTMNVMRLGACLYGKGAISNDNIIITWKRSWAKYGMTMMTWSLSLRHHWTPITLSSPLKYTTVKAKTSGNWEVHSLNSWQDILHNNKVDSKSRHVWCTDSQLPRYTACVPGLGFVDGKLKQNRLIL